MKSQTDRQRGYKWAPCPVCGKPDMAWEARQYRKWFVNCTNGDCWSNGGIVGRPPGTEQTHEKA